MKIALLLTVLIASTYSKEVLQELCGKSMETKQNVWNCLIERYKLAKHVDGCFHHLGTYTGAQYLNSLCGPRTYVTEAQSNFDKCVQTYDASIEELNHDEENHLIKECIIMAS